MADKTPNYSPEQEKIIRDMFASKGSPLDKADAETLANDERMNGTDGARKPRAIIAKITRMDGVDYAKAGPVSKTGKPVQKKLDLVARIAKLAGVEAGKLDGMDASPKQALEALADAVAALAA